MAKGPEKLSGITGRDGKTDFGGVDEGDYAVSVTAIGYRPSAPVTIKVKKKTEYTERLDRIEPAAQVGAGGIAPPVGPGSRTVSVEPDRASRLEAGTTAPPTNLLTQEPGTTVAKPSEEGPAPAATLPESPPSEGEVADEIGGWGGGRVGQIIRTFQQKGAISPETALTAEELGLSRLSVRIMKRRKGKTRVFVEVDGRYYLNQKALRESQ